MKRIEYLSDINCQIPAYAGMTGTIIFEIAARHSITIFQGVPRRSIYMNTTSFRRKPES
jgi:hypothetical protein